MTFHRPMRILLVGDFPNDPTLGSSKVVDKLRDEFNRLGHACDALFAEDLGDQPRQRHARDMWAPVLAATAIARASYNRGPYDVIDVAGAEAIAFATLRRTGGAGSAALISRSNGLEHLNYARLLRDADAGLISKPWYRRLWYPAFRLRPVRRAIEAADRLILLNDEDRDYIVARGWKQPSAIDVVGHGVSECFLESAPSTGTPRGAGVLFCGSWDVVKGVPYLAAAWRLLAAEGVAPALTILGGGRPAESILADFAPHVRSSVTVKPRVPEQQVIQEYRRHDLLVMCSTYEGFGMVVPEAMSQGLPVVATPVGVARTFVRDGETGLVVPPRNPEAIAVAIRRLMTDEALRVRLSCAGRRAVCGMSWTATARRTLEVYARARALVTAA
jgi:glycosyltransferase involved in cell wall biosynthesis